MSHPLRIQVAPDPAKSLAEYARVSIAFEINSVLDVSAPNGDAGQFLLSERAIDTPTIKDYDITIENPALWRERFDLSTWGLFRALVAGEHVGGAAIAFRSQGVEMLGRDDLAVLWDIRVAPEMRGKGVGSALLRAAEEWASAKGATSMKIETQNINVPACRFYSRQGYVLRAANA